MPASLLTFAGKGATGCDVSCPVAVIPTQTHWTVLMILTLLLPLIGLSRGGRPALVLLALFIALDLVVWVGVGPPTFGGGPGR